MKVKVNEIANVVACVDCKYYHRTFSMWLTQTDARCTRGYKPTVNLVTGKVSKINFYSLDRCYRERTNDYDSNCGIEGEYWAPRKSTPKTTMLLLKRTGNETN
jgi:hypothetical protein